MNKEKWLEFFNTHPAPESDNLLPWYVWAVMVLALIAMPVDSYFADQKSGNEKAQVLKENRVYISKQAYDDFVKNNQ